MSSPEPAYRQFVYRVECEGAVRVCKNAHSVGDADVTLEHWITDSVVQLNGGTILLTLVGVIPDTGLARAGIVALLDRRRSAHLDPAGIYEMEQVWIVDSSADPPAWSPRAELFPTIDDDSPLPPPPGLLDLPPDAPA